MHSIYQVRIKPYLNSRNWIIGLLYFDFNLYLPKNPFSMMPPLVNNLVKGLDLLMKSI